MSSSSISSSVSLSIITLLIYAHGKELTQRFNDATVRIVYFAGRFGSVYLSERDEVAKIHKIFDDVTREYSQQLTEIIASERLSKKQFMKQLYERFPQANTCKIIPNFIFDEDGIHTQSTFDFLNKYIASGPHVDKYKILAKNKKKFTVNFETTAPNFDKFAIEDAETNQTHRLHTPVINKVYYFFDIDDDKPITDFMIEVLDTCNDTGTAPVQLGDILSSSKKAYNKVFKETFFSKSNKRPTITLQDIVNYVHSLGFDIINIIDVSCRACEEIDEAHRDRITEMEHEKIAEINQAFGKKYKKQYTKKNKRKKRK